MRRGVGSEPERDSGILGYRARPPAWYAGGKTLYGPRRSRRSPATRALDGSAVSIAFDSVPRRVSRERGTHDRRSSPPRGRRVHGGLDVAGADESVGGVRAHPRGALHEGLP